ncbi:MAG: glycosyltransferase family 2 protein [Candidatus Gastranaerophilaceae bacterium]
MNNKLAIIVPCYNEEEIIGYCIEQLTMLLSTMIDDGLISINSQICFVNDGSKDNTENIIKKYCNTNKRLAFINLNKNYGQQYAMLAGLYTVDADMYVTIDADLQDDYTLITEMVKKYLSGFEIVYGCRKKRDTDSFYKRNTALLFYRFMNLIGVKIRPNHSEFRLLSKRAVNMLKEYKEKIIFLRGIIQNLQLKSCDVYYDRLERVAGKTKYSFGKLFGLAWTAITSYSFLPLRLITFTGVTISLISTLLLLYNFLIYLTKHKIISYWIYIAIIMAFFSGLTIISLGIIGEYLSKIFIEVKGRPLYQIEETINL